MRWRDRQGSSNVRSGGRGTGKIIGGGSLLLGLIVLLLTGNPLAALNVGLNSAPITNGSVRQEPLSLSEKEKELYHFSSVALKDTEDTWHTLLKQQKKDYQEAEMIIFQQKVKTGCGIADSGTGPFYCGRDRSVYMDLSFYDMLVNQFGAEKNEFILSYVISHEIGHHVQNELGILDEVNRLRQRAGEAERNALTVRLELMADYLAGVVARHQQEEGYLEKGDLDAAIQSAWSIGDDAIQKRIQGHVTPESFTHGSSKQRARWYKKGYEAGNLDDFNTFDLDRYPTVDSL
ncbi:neutral zinc metallopeptidase [Murdochiella vaginalis]|uniref:KPN_02809 family neutral zinc metallopeptidase n=1 Tax=Murdochiella vaginalis TaxID=1852373 RepID=UPI0008FE28A8|nr:neutral zinc metallopeptidase [Murdochiella vaginalis]